MSKANFRDYINPVINAINNLGGSATPQEIYKYIAESLKLDDKILNEKKENGRSLYETQVAFARFYLAKADFIDSSKHGIWSLTDKGRQSKDLAKADIDKLIKDVNSQFLSRPKDATRNNIHTKDENDEGELNEDAYKDELLNIIHSLPPSGFERLCQRLLRESGFQEVTVNGKSGDGGIDGIGILQINPFVSFKVLFQSKRYSGSVGVEHIRNFQASMMGRADKGIIITTGTYTAAAKMEATRDGVPPIELVDGEKLVNMFEQLELGLKPRTTYEINFNFFDDFKE